MFSAEGSGVKLVLFIIILRNVQNHSACNVIDTWNIKVRYCDICNSYIIAKYGNIGTIDKIYGRAE